MTDNLTYICEQINQGQIRGNKRKLAELISDSLLLAKLNNMSVGQFAWHIVNDTWQMPVCKVCSGTTKFNTHRRKYAPTCSKTCTYADSDRMDKIAATTLIRYGNTNAARVPEIQERKKANYQKYHGVDHPSQLQAVKDKKLQTMRNNWGVDNPSQSSEIQQKKICTNQEKRGVDWPTQDVDIKKQIEDTNLNRYGSRSSLSNDIVRQKCTETMIQKYGVPNPQQSLEIQQKTINTNLIKYGVATPFQNEEIKRKIQNTNLLRYGSTCWWASDIAKELLPQIHLSRRGFINPAQDPVVQNKIRTTILNKYGVPHINYCNKTLDQIMALTNPQQFKDAVTGCTPITAAEKLGVHESTIYRLSNEYNCRNLLNLTINQYEQKITNLLDSINVDYIIHDRTIIAPNEIDIYIPSHNLAIEVGSIYWHGEQFGKHQNYHKDKWKKCQDKNIKLFQWFNSDLNEYWHLTKSKLLRTLGKTLPVIGARKTTIGECTINEEQDFLTKWHIKGFTNSRNNVIAARYNNHIVGLLSINQQNNNAIIERWATDITISWPGLFSRCIAYWIKKTGFTGNLRTWCDNRLGDGNVYHATGFTKIKISKPGYWYFKNDGLENRQRYQKHRLMKLFNLSKDDMVLREIDIMRAQGYDRFWDAGHTLWSKTI